MKKLIFLISVLAVFIFSPAVSGEMMMDRRSTGVEDHTQKEEAEGKAIWEKLQNKKIDCQKLTDDQFEALGEYFMGQMMGESHPAMNQMMVRMMGEEGEKQMHIVMGKRMSGCQPQAAYPSGWGWMMPMIGGGWMMGGWPMTLNQNPEVQQVDIRASKFGSGQVGGWWWGFFGWWMFLVQILVLVILILLVVYLWKKIKK